MHAPADSADGFPPVRHLMYCAEQIVIPQPFPHILKTYAKGTLYSVSDSAVEAPLVPTICPSRHQSAVIRTQPYDLLRWSAAYFRCLATNVPPPVKQRLERDCRFGTLTRGYLVVLLEQLGKGFFVDRTVLQNRWESMSLPEVCIIQPPVVPTLRQCHSPPSVGRTNC